MEVLRYCSKYRLIETVVSFKNKKEKTIITARVYKVQIKWLFFWVTIKTYINMNKPILAYYNGLRCYYNLYNV